MLIAHSDGLDPVAIDVGRNGFGVEEDPDPSGAFVRREHGIEHGMGNLELVAEFGNIAATRIEVAP